jgi:hypothetical protein
MIEMFVAWALTTLVSAFVGSYLAGYLKQKGQNLATHEDIDKLVDQVRVVTKTTKEIEAKISDEVWDRQKRWELKRDLLVDMLKKISNLQGALQRLHAVRLTNKESGDPENVTRVEVTHASTLGFNTALGEYDQAKLVVDLVCGLEVKRTLLYYEKIVSDTGQAVIGGDVAAFGRTQKEILIKETAVVNAVRDELGSGSLIPPMK